MAIQWLSKPEERTIMTPGKPWEYCLPLACAADMPLIEWSCDPTAADVCVDTNDSRKVVITLPMYLEAYFGDITYCIHDADQLYRGQIKVLVQRQPVSSESMSGVAAAPDAAQAPIRSGDATPAVATPAKDAVSPPQSPDDMGLPVRPTITRAASGPLQEEDEKPVPNTDDLPIPPVAFGPALTGGYAVEVLRRGVRVTQSVTPVCHGRTTMIGRSSSSHGIPHLDLHRQFETKEDEAECSRRQAEVFWSEERIFIKTVGRNPLRLLGDENRPEAELPSPHCWQPGQTLILPGGLHLVLKKQRS